jgi:hypothetical protein
MFEIKKVKKLSVANIAALLYAFFGFVGSFIASIYSLVIFVHEKHFDQKLAMYILTNLGLGFLIALAAAIIAGIVGWILGIIAAAFYNFIVKTVGGIKVELADETGQVAAIKAESSFARATEDKNHKQELFKY